MDTNTRNKANSTGLGPKRIAVAIVLGLLMFTACTSIDCPMNNSVMLKMVFKGDVTTLTDTLTITAIRTGAEDTIVYYKGVNITSVSVPMSYSRDIDSYRLTFKTADEVETEDVIEIKKTNEPAFTSVDCSPAYYHTLTEVSTTNNRLEQVTINNSKVNTDATQEHLYLYLRP